MTRDEQYFRDAAYGAASKDLALTAFGIYAGLTMARDPENPSPLYAAAAAVQEDVCGLLCPSQWETAKGRPPHHPKCVALREALGRACFHCEGTGERYAKDTEGKLLVIKCDRCNGTGVSAPSSNAQVAETIMPAFDRAITELKEK